MRRQCELLELNRASWYYEPVPESTENLALMRRIDEQYLATPFYGSRRLAVWLQRQGVAIRECTRHGQGPVLRGERVHIRRRACLIGSMLYRI